ncbi:hypothetical protein ACFVAV_23335 [Nocardia sp. NPDC057663]|uniref:hypothetical protein n=1 Tax=Nocardia sp. NPDC057663 TaxID=3346201 RepID=UPI00366DFA6F
MVEEFGDGRKVLIVLRSSWLTEESPLYAEVAAYLAAHPHTLEFEEHRADADIEGGTAVLTQYEIHPEPHSGP